LPLEVREHPGFQESGSRAEQQFVLAHELVMVRQGNLLQSDPGINEHAAGARVQDDSGGELLGGRLAVEKAQVVAFENYSAHAVQCTFLKLLAAVRSPDGDPCALQLSQVGT